MRMPKSFVIKLSLSFVHIPLSLAARPIFGLYAGPILGGVLALIKVT